MRLDRPSVTRSLMTAGITAALLGFTPLPAAAVPAHAHKPSPAAVVAPNARSAAARQKAFDHTQALMALQKRWSRAKGAEKSRALDRLLAKAEERRAFLLDLMDSNPAAVLSAAIPDQKQTGMPAEVLEKLEQSVQLEGELEVLYVDTEEFGDSHRRHQLHTAFGERFELRVAGKHSNLQTGDKVNVSGVLFERANGEEAAGIIAASDDQDGILKLALGGTGVDGEPGPVANTFGEQKTLVVLVNFQNDTSQPWSRSEVSTLMNGEISDFMRENSYGQTWINADVAGWFTMPYSNDYCGDVTYGDWAIQAAKAAGFNTDSYDRFIFAWPRNAQCGYLGLGTVGGAPSKAWINGSFTFATVAHEFGHNLGLAHARDWICDGGTLDGSCRSNSYGDYPDIMGAGYQGHFNAFQKDRLGWLGYGSSPELTLVESSGTFTLSPYEKQDSAPKALKILKGVDSVSGNKEWYYLEARQLLGFDAGMSSNWLQNFTRGITVRKGIKETGAGYLLDLTPSSAYGHTDAALEAGYTYDDGNAGVTVTTDWVNTSGAQVTVNLDGGSVTPTCTRANPSLSVTPGESQWVEAGTSFTYSVTLTNRDSSACNSSSYNLAATQPSGWSSAFGSNALTLAPGASQTTRLQVTSASNAADGFYTINLAATSGGYAANGSVTYVVDTPDSVNSAPVANNDSAATSENTPVTIKVLSNDSDPDGDPLHLSSVSGVNGSATINGDGSITFTPSGGFSGTEQFSYSISDGKGGSDTASVSVTVAAAPSGNTAPVAIDDSASLSNLTSVTIPVLGNDWDPEGDTLKVTAATQGSKGSVRLNADGSLTYTPGKRFKNSDSFSYTISDGKLSATALVSVQLDKSSADTGKGNGKGPNK